MFNMGGVTAGASQGQQTSTNQPDENQSQNPDSTSGNNNPDQNNAGANSNDMFDLDNLWSTPENTTQQPNQPGQQAQQPITSQQSIHEQIKKHLANSGVSIPEMEDNPELASTLENALVGVYTQVMKDANTMFQQALSQTREETIQVTNQNFMAQNLEETLRQDFAPQMNDSFVGPIVRAIATQLVNKGVPRHELTDKINLALGQIGAHVNSQGRVPQTGRDSVLDQEIDWEQFFQNQT